MSALSDADRRILRFLSGASAPMNARTVAAAVWPDSKGWNGDRRGTTGTSIQMVAGRALRRLADRHLVHVQYTTNRMAMYSISGAGREALDAEV